MNLLKTILSSTSTSLQDSQYLSFYVSKARTTLALLNLINDYQSSCEHNYPILRNMQLTRNGNSIGFKHDE